jgi:hypothetical protein
LRSAVLSATPKKVASAPERSSSCTARGCSALAA